MASGGRFADLFEGDLEKILDENKNVIKCAVLNDYLAEKEGDCSCVINLDETSTVNVA